MAATLDQAPLGADSSGLNVGLCPEGLGPQAFRYSQSRQAIWQKSQFDT